jgi:hypothetical protein
MDDYYSDIAFLSSSDDDENDQIELNAEEWQDWNSETLLNLWMSIVEYHEEWYLPLNKTFNDFCEFVYEEEDKGEPLDKPMGLDNEQGSVLGEIQAIKDHPLIKGLDWNKFFSVHK